jgi:hypothetical protein
MVIKRKKFQQHPERNEKYTFHRVCSSNDRCIRRTIPSVTSITKSAHSAGWLLASLVFEHEDEGSTFLQNVGKLLPDYTVSHPGKQYSSRLQQLLDKS